MGVRKFLQVGVFTAVGVAGLGGASGALAKTVQMPLSGWKLSPVQADAGAPVMCQLATSFYGGGRLSFIAGNGAVQAMRLHFADPVFGGVDAQGYVKSLIGFSGNDYYEVDIAVENPHSVLIALSGADALMNSLMRSPILNFERGAVKEGFSLIGLQRHLKSLPSCEKPPAVVHSFVDVKKDKLPVRQVYRVSEEDPFPPLRINPNPVGLNDSDKLASGSASAEEKKQQNEMDAVFARVMLAPEEATVEKKPVVELGRMSDEHVDMTAKKAEDPIDLSAELMEEQERARLAKLERTKQELAKELQRTEKYEQVVNTVVPPAPKIVWQEPEITQKAPVVQEPQVEKVAPQVQEIVKAPIVPKDDVSVAPAVDSSAEAEEEKGESISWRAARVKTSIARPVQLDEVIQPDQGDLVSATQGIEAPVHTKSLVDAGRAVEAAAPSVSVPVKDVEPVPAKVVQQARWMVRSGDSLREVLAMWSLESDAELIWDTPSEFTVPIDGAYNSVYEDSVGALLHQFSGRSGVRRPIGELFSDPASGKKVLVVKTEDRIDIGM